MNESEGAAARFEAHRDHLRGVAFRMLGSLDEADDAVQRAWLRVDRADARGIENPAGWLTTIVARVCLDMLRTRRARREEPLTPDTLVQRDGGTEPEQETVLAESVGVALLVVLERLAPAERVAFVLHDVFGVPFGEIATAVGRSPVAAKKLASRARKRVRGAEATGTRADLAGNHAVVEAFLLAARDGDLSTLVELLAPDVVRRADRFAVPEEIVTEVRGARAVAEETRVFAHRARTAEVALVDGRPGIVVAPRGRLLAVLLLTVAGGRITEIEVIGDPARLRLLPLATVPAGSASGN
ncbi:sigma-70 family RNA polymerase sigma factor [Qaidamihabitans albus]|uniref:sigma-70 family RNA polymerase sigma factor n=1 Tax=Qaidamihabitans albus TaxID=2795733 RepID=UPI0018F22A5F|nr:sigma-70 family RNA polymerase sigma factor [Qaidamihabitans albus]